MKERCRDGCRTSLLIAGVVLVPNIFHTLLPSCHPYITIYFMEMIFPTCITTQLFIIHYDTNFLGVKSVGYNWLHIKLQVDIIQNNDCRQ